MIDETIKYLIFGITAGLLSWPLMLIVCFFLIKSGKNIELHLFGYHFHDSLYALPLIIGSLFFTSPTRAFLLGIAIGIIIHHTVRDGFLFITPSQR